MAQLIRAKMCSNCGHSRRTGSGQLECHEGPPTVTPIVGQGADGRPAVIARVTSFPEPQPDWECDRHTPIHALAAHAGDVVAAPGLIRN